MRKRETPLTTVEQEVLRELQEAVRETDGEVSRRQAVEAVESEAPELDVEEIIHSLLQKGYLYDVDGMIRVT